MMRVATRMFLCCLASMAASAAADAPASPPGLRERFDENSRVIERIYHDGRLLQFSWDTTLDRVVRIDGGTEKDGVVWTHHFLHDAAGSLIGEYDCLGEHHALEARASIDVERGSALAKHRHGGAR